MRCLRFHFHSLFKMVRFNRDEWIFWVISMGPSDRSAMPLFDSNFSTCQGIIAVHYDILQLCAWDCFAVFLHLFFSCNVVSNSSWPRTISFVIIVLCFLMTPNTSLKRYSWMSTKEGKFHYPHFTDGDTGALQRWICSSRVSKLAVNSSILSS